MMAALTGGSRSRTRVGAPLLASATVLLACLFIAQPSLAQNAAPALTSNNDIASAGYFRLSWETDAELVELQEASDSTFRQTHILYTGRDRATLISGKADGTWHYRIRSMDKSDPGPWSAPVTVTVAHHSLSRALMFFALGIVVFVMTLLLVVRGPGRIE